MRPSFIGRLKSADDTPLRDRLRRTRTPDAPDALQLSDTVVPLPETSMRILEFAVACTALAAAALLSLVR